MIAWKIRRTVAPALWVALLVLPVSSLEAAGGDLPLDLQFREVQSSVWERADAQGSTEHLASGPEGLAWALTQLHEQSNRELELYRLEPTADRWARIQQLAATREEIRGDISAARSLGLGEALQSIRERAGSCPYEYDVAADAFPLGSGAGASSSADWWSGCSQLGSVYCYAYAEVDSLYDSESKSGSGTSVLRSCSASVSGSGDCYSYARSYVYVASLSLYVQRTATNTDCGAIPLSATLSCTQHPVGGGYPQVDCTASASGGVPPYQPYWKHGNQAETSGGWSYNFTCKYLSAGFTPFTVRLRVEDSSGADAFRFFYCGNLDP